MKLFHQFFSSVLLVRIERLSMNDDRWEAEMSHLSDDDIVIDASFEDVMAMVDTCFEDMGIDALVEEQLQSLKLQINGAAGLT